MNNYNGFELETTYLPKQYNKDGKEVSIGTDLLYNPADTDWEAQLKINCGGHDMAGIKSSSRVCILTLIS